jgi:hypothetical protein
MFASMKVAHVDGTVVDCEGRRSDAIRFERHYGIPSTRIVGDDGLFVEHLWYFGWLAESRVRDVGEFDEWMDTVDSVEIATDDDAETDPTNPSSSPSA